jgi:hypothetical protein
VNCSGLNCRFDLCLEIGRWPQGTILVQNPNASQSCACARERKGRPKAAFAVRTAGVSRLVKRQFGDRQFRRASFVRAMPRIPQPSSLPPWRILSVEMTHGKHPRSACAGVPARSRLPLFSDPASRQPPAEPTRTIKGAVPCMDLVAFSPAKTVNPFAAGGGAISAFADLSSPALSPTLPSARTATLIMLRLPPRYRSIDESGTDRMSLRRYCRAARISSLGLTSCERL